MLFETNPVNLSELVSKARTGEVQLPDFQRPWKWDDERIVSLLATVALGYPLGVMMTLETGGSELQFKARPIEGADIPDGAMPAELLMDGQQRLTSLLQALASEDPVDTKDARGKKLLRWYYVDIECVLDPNADMKDAIVSVPTDRKVLDASGKRVTLDLATREAEFAAGMFPLRVVYDSQARGRWRRGYENSADSHPDIWERFEATVLKNIDIYQIPVIRLNKATPKEAVCTVFEYVNTKGVQLTTFELLTATYAANREYSAEHGEDFHLPAEWAALKERLARHNAVSEIDDTDFLRAVCLVSTHFRRRGRPGTTRSRSLRQAASAPTSSTWSSASIAGGRPKLNWRWSGVRDSSTGRASSSLTTCRTAPRSPLLPLSGPCWALRRIVPRRKTRSRAGTGAASWASSTAGR
jgi:Protein of unknown function DUF262